MKKSKKFFTAIICIVTILAFLPAFTAYAEDGNFKIGLSVDKSARPGEKINVICTVKDITTESGLCGISFTLTYDTKALTPDVVSSNVEDTSPYDSFMKKVPQYTISAGGTEAQVPAYENISRCYPDEGKYTLMYIDLLVYPGIKSGTSVDSALKKDGDLTLAIPFTVNKEISDGYKASIKITKGAGTTAGKEMKSVQCSDNSIILEIGNNGSSVITSPETQNPVTTSASSEIAPSLTGTAGGESSETGVPTASASANISNTETSKPAATVSATNDTKTTDGAENAKKDKSSTPIYIAAGVSLLAVALVIVLYLKKKNK